MELDAPPDVVPMDSPPRHHHQCQSSNNSTILHLQGFVRHLEEENNHLRNLLEQKELEHDVAVRDMETRIGVLSQTLEETRASKKKLGMQKEYFMGLCDTWGEYAEIFRHSLMGLAGEALREDNPRFAGTSVGWLKQSLFAANLFLKVLEDWIQHEQWEKLKKVRFYRHFYGYRPKNLNRQYTNIIPLHHTEPLFPPGFCEDVPAFDMNFPEREYRDCESLPKPFGWYRRLPDVDYMSSSDYAVFEEGEGNLRSMFPYWDIDGQEEAIPIRDALISEV